MPDPAVSSDVTGLLLRWSEGDAAALRRLLPLVYGELRRIARTQLRRDRPNQTLAPTALVHELYLRLVDQSRASWHDRAHFYAVAANLMRRVVVDHARARQAEKRGGGTLTISLDQVDENELPRAGGRRGAEAEMLAVDGALTRLAAVDPDQARIIELRFFAGLTVEETAHVLKRSPRTVKREWRLAKAWLYRELR
ncbi:MAG: sigma-70 family RNA polymerase sigma factor [Acidobacteria bacterium]|nr:sigma-70 family RNA polymerase sigma factor [Acidobacteriota bacterium]